MSTRDRRKSDDEVQAHEEVRQILVPAPRGRPPDEMFPVSSPDQAQYQSGSNGAGRPAVGQPATSANEATAVGTAAAVRWTTSNEAAFQIELPRSRPRQSRPPREAISPEKLRGYADEAERRIVELAARWFEPGARIAIFVIYFWFGFLKVIGLSPATPLASALTSHTIGMQYFNVSFKALAFYECGIAVLFLIPALTWLSVVLLVIHMGIVTSPLVIVANVAWTHPLVPTLEGQYIIKDLAIIALAIGILAHRYRYRQQAAPQLTRLAAAAVTASAVDRRRPNGTTSARRRRGRSWRRDGKSGVAGGVTSSRFRPGSEPRRDGGRRAGLHKPIPERYDVVGSILALPMPVLIDARRPHHQRSIETFDSVRLINQG